MHSGLHPGIVLRVLAGQRICTAHGHGAWYDAWFGEWSDPSRRKIRQIPPRTNGNRQTAARAAAEAWDSGPDPLTDRERQILREAGEGKSSQEIAESLHLSEGTVRNYLSEAISKLGAANRIDAARIARAKGWL